MLIVLRKTKKETEAEYYIWWCSNFVDHCRKTKKEKRNVSNFVDCCPKDEKRKKKKEKRNISFPALVPGHSDFFFLWQPLLTSKEYPILILACPGTPFEFAKFCAAKKQAKSAALTRKRDIVDTKTHAYSAA